MGDTPIPIPAAKRVFDIVAALTIGIVLLPVIIAFLVVSLAERLVRPSAHGPWLFVDRRVSQGRVFNLYKFRISPVAALTEAAAQGSVDTKTLERKGQLTIAGLLLKTVYLDECPQLWNVLRGDMSMVGPRPVSVAVYEHGRTVGIRSRTILVAGLTGPYQSHKAARYGLDQEAVDMVYADFCRSHGGLRVTFRDCVILWQTVLAVFRAEGL